MPSSLLLSSTILWHMPCTHHDSWRPLWGSSRSWPKACSRRGSPPTPTSPSSCRVTAVRAGPSSSSSVQRHAVSLIVLGGSTSTRSRATARDGTSSSSALPFSSSSPPRCTGSAPGAAHRHCPPSVCVRAPVRPLFRSASVRAGARRTGSLRSAASICASLHHHGGASDPLGAASRLSIHSSKAMA